MLRMCVYIYSRFVKNHPIRIVKNGPLISKMVLSQTQQRKPFAHSKIPVTGPTLLATPRIA
jgi:hypothetical protein